MTDIYKYKTGTQKSPCYVIKILTFPLCYGTILIKVNGGIYMFTRNEILNLIKRECFEHNGSSFDARDQYLTFCWSKEYTGKKFLFSTKWIYQGTKDKEKIKQAEKILLKLPTGITYTRNDIITEKLPEKASEYMSKYERFTTTFSIHVSAEYSQNVVNQNNGRRIVIIDNFDKQTMENADAFKNLVLTKHSEILEPLFLNGFSKLPCLTNSGFTDYDCRGYSLQSVNMKPLQNESQRLGLMLALGEYGEKFIPNNEYWFIDGHSSDSINISRSQIRYTPHLNDW